MRIIVPKNSAASSWVSWGAHGRGDGSSSLVPAATDSDDATGVLLDVYSMAPAVPLVPTYVWLTATGNVSVR
jgi:hypothetical protein